MLLCHPVCLPVSPSTHSFQVKFLYFSFVCVFEFFLSCITHSLTHSFDFCYVFGGSEVLDGVFFVFVLGRTSSCIIVLERFGWPLERPFLL